MPDSPARRNIELKATDPDPAQSLAACLALGAADHGVLDQRDTYFDVAHGRLKLREQRPGAAQLIHYERADRARQRQSSYRLLEIDDPAATLELLGAALGVTGVVEKRRRLLLWRGVRIHLDDVAGLGNFVELEAVAAAGSDLDHEHRLVDELRAVLSIGDDRILAHGYAQLLARRRDGEPAPARAAAGEPTRAPAAAGEPVAAMVGRPATAGSWRPTDRGVR